MLKPGTVLAARYRLRHLVAEGGMAEIYLAERSILKYKKFYAIKRLRPFWSAHAMYTDIFALEASLALSLRHKNILHCYELIKDGQELFIVMEFVCGKDIHALMPLLKSLSLDDRTRIACRLGMKVCEALSYLHSKTDSFFRPLEIVHGDISPHNIMLTEKGEIKLFDFGAAQTAHDHHRFLNEIVQGNLHYMAPEQIRGVPVDQRCDLFSLGLVLLEIINGDRVFQSHSKSGFESIGLRDLLGNVGKAVFVNDRIREFFLTSLAEDREKRFSSSKEMHEALEKIFPRLSFRRNPLKILMVRPLPSVAKNAKIFLCCLAIVSGIGMMLWKWGG